MTIAIDLTPLSYHITGIERYALCISEELVKLDSDNKYILVFRDNIYPTFTKYVNEERIKSVVIKGNNKLLFHELRLAKTLYSIKADRYLFLSFMSPILFRGKGIINTIHDMGAWDAAYAMTFKQKLYCRIAGRISTKNSKEIITVSEFSKKRICDILHMQKDRVHVVPSAITKTIINSTSVIPEEIQKAYNLPEKYIMSLSTIEPRKNMKLLIEAYLEICDKVDFDLVLVGRLGWKMEEVVEKYKKNKRIHFTDFIPDEHIAYIYKNALCFVFPSRYEGFGLPPLEALAMGTPVISSDAASMPEVLRQQAVFFKNDDREELRSLLIDLNNLLPNMPHELDEYQKDNFRFDASAKKLLRILESVKE